MRATIVLLVVVVTLAGCGRQPYVTEPRLENGLVVFLTGIDGRTLISELICKSLDDAGVDWAIRLEDWTSKWGPMVSLQGDQRNRRVAASVAEQIGQYRESYPGRPVVVIGQSGGGGMAAWVVESLAEGTEVDGVILIVPALSPTYDLKPALSKSRRGVVSVYSNLDWVILGLGTSVYGTMDREHTASAGKVGFETQPAGQGSDLAEKLFQIKWDESMISTGYLGGHATSGAAPVFIKRFIAPMVLSDEWSEAFIDSLKRGEEVSQPPIQPVEPAPESPPPHWPDISADAVINPA